MRTNKPKKNFIYELTIVALVCTFMIGNITLAYNINLEDIDSGVTSPTGQFRWLDVADQQYGTNYINNYDYTQADVQIDYYTDNQALYGILTASNLKPNFAYQLKLVGTSGTPANEYIGYAGRWWQEEWNNIAGTWTNGQNLNNKGSGTSPNPNDLVYESRKDIPDVDSPTGFHYKYTGYLVFDYFITDENGDINMNFRTDSSYHVLWKTSQRTQTGNDGPIKTSNFDPKPGKKTAYDINYPPQTISIFGEWERLPVGGITLQTGTYNDVQIILTEESFHGSGGAPYCGNWAAAMGATIDFVISTTPSPAEMQIDIKPGDEENIVDITSKATLPVAILTTPGFNAQNVNTNTILFLGDAPDRMKFQDFDKDNDIDLVLYFKIQELDFNLIEEINQENYATLTCETNDGIAHEAQDTIILIQKNKRN